jgi:hypothetical protein
MCELFMFVMFKIKSKVYGGCTIYTTFSILKLTNHSKPDRTWNAMNLSLDAEGTKQERLLKLHLLKNVSLCLLNEVSDLSATTGLC